MNKLFTICLSLLFVASSAFASVTSTISRFASPDAISTPEMRKQANWGLTGRSQQLRQQQMLTEIGIPMDTTISNQRGFLKAPDGSDWIYVANVRTQSWGYYKSASYDIYDGQHNHRGSFSLNIPSNKTINSISLNHVITNKFFDTNENTYEVLVHLHEIVSPGVTDNHIYVYNTNGDSITYFHGTQSDIIHIQKNSYTTFERMLLVTPIDSLVGSYNDTTFAELEDNSVDTIVETKPIYDTFQKISFYKPKGWSNTNEIEKTMLISDQQLINVDDAPWIYAYTIDNEAYYALSFYEQPFYSGWSEDHLYQIPTPNNHFIVQVYDEQYNLVNTLRIPCEDMGGSAYKKYSIGALTYDDLSKGFFTGDDQWNYLISAHTYDFVSDEDKFDFVVYDSKSQLIKTIDTNVDLEGIKVLSDIEGYERQLAFGHTETNANDEVTAYIKVINIPSCKIAATLSPTSEAPVSFTFDRTAKQGGYEYAISYTQPEVDADDNIYAVIGWFDKDFRFDRKVLFNIGTDGLIANPLLNASSLNPYLINTNDKHEYIYLWSVPKNNGTEEKHWHLCLADHEGKTIVDYAGNPSKGDIREVGIMNAHSNYAALYVDYYDDNRSRHHIEYISLPLTKFERGGKGTKEEPYLIASRGDLEQIANESKAYYKQVEDIDMGVCGRSWTPIANFKGNYDGDNHILVDMTIRPSGGDILGLFAEMSDSAVVSNLHFKHPVIEISEYNPQVGVLTANASNAVEINNVHVSDAYIYANSDEAIPSIGGIAGYVAFNSSISASSFDGEISVPSAYPVGGIAASAATTTPITACAFTGSIIAGSEIGGIVGQQGDKSSVTNCHVTGKLKGQHTIGGIVGSSPDRAAVANNIAEVELISTSTTWDASMGGIIGSLGGDQDQTGTKIIQNNVAVIENVEHASSETDNTIHGIVGQSIENETLEPGEKAYYELGLTKNYVTKEIGSSTNSHAHDNVNGEVITVEALDKTFFKNLGYVYGNSTTAPWVDGTLPYLYIEQPDDSSVENIESDNNTNSIARKVFRNGTIYIIRGEDVYLIDGRKL